MRPVTVTIPVGPLAVHQRWLDEAIGSVREQTHPVKQILLIDDMAGMAHRGNGVTVWHAPWHLGVATAFNIGVALAQYNLVFMLGADDKLLPTCIEECVAEYERSPERDRDLTYYAVPVRYSDGRDDQFVPCNAAMVTKALWRHCGGFPAETSSGAPDAALLSIFMRHREAGTFRIVGNEPLYWYRSHNDTDTAQRGPWQGVILETRHLVSDLWSPPAWEGLKRPSFEGLSRVGAES